MKKIRVYSDRLYKHIGTDAHPQRYVESLGFKVVRFEGVPIADCVFMEIEGDFDNLRLI